MVHCRDFGESVLMCESTVELVPLSLTQDDLEE